MQHASRSARPAFGATGNACRSAGSCSSAGRLAIATPSPRWGSNLFLRENQDRLVLPSGHRAPPAPAPVYADFRGYATCLIRTHFSTTNRRFSQVFWASKVRDMRAD